MCWLDVIRDKVVKRTFRFMSRTLISTVVKLINFIRNIPVQFVRIHSNFYPCNKLENGPAPNTYEYGLENEPDANTPSYVREKAVDEDRVRPCVQRLQRLESLLEELDKKPAEIPVEKDQILQQSLDRIKSVELDLEKTKRVNISSILAHFIYIIFAICM